MPIFEVQKNGKTYEVDAPTPQAAASAAIPDFRSENAKDTEGNAVVDPNTIGTFARTSARRSTRSRSGNCCRFRKPPVARAGMRRCKPASTSCRRKRGIRSTRPRRRAIVRPGRAEGLG
jgi:hypothetical protein